MLAFFNSEDFMPHGHCFLWKPDILWLHVASNAAIALAYFCIPLTLLYFIRRRSDVPYRPIFALFSTFIFLCGTTHLMGIWVLWRPDYALDGVVKALTAAVSLATLFMLVRVMPRAMKLVGPSELHRVNAELADAYREMEARVEDRTEELSRAVQELARSNVALDEFAHMVSHDLKEPLRGLRNQALFLQEDYAGKLDEKGVERLRRLSEICGHMDALIGDLLHFSRLGHEKRAVQETDVNQVVKEVRLVLQERLMEANAVIEVPEKLPVFTCDRPGLTEILRNLVTNALKYNDKQDKKIEIGFLEEAKTAEGEGRNVFYVKDNGIGIPREAHEAVFRMFKRFHIPAAGFHTGAAAQAEGTGAGLAFVKRIIERWDARIWIESEPGRGATFYFTTGPGGGQAQEGRGLRPS